MLIRGSPPASLSIVKAVTGCMRTATSSLCSLADDTGPDGLEGDICDTPRPLKEGEEAEWILLSGVSHKDHVSGLPAYSNRRLRPAPISLCTTYILER